MVEHSGVPGVPLLPGACVDWHRGEELGNRLSLGGAAECLLYGALGVVGVGKLYEGAVVRDSDLQWKRLDERGQLVHDRTTVVRDLQVPCLLAKDPSSVCPLVAPQHRGFNRLDERLTWLLLQAVHFCAPEGARRRCGPCWWRGGRGPNSNI